MKDIIGENCGCSEMEIGFYDCESCTAGAHIYVKDVSETEMVDCWQCGGEMVICED